LIEIQVRCLQLLDPNVDPEVVFQGGSKEEENDDDEDDGQVLDYFEPYQ